MKRAFPDSEDLLGEALTAPARGAAPSARDIRVSLAAPSDEIRWWREAPEPAVVVGAASWTGAERLPGAGIVRPRVLAGSRGAARPAGAGRGGVPDRGPRPPVGLPVRVEGRPESGGGFRRLTRTSQVVPVQVDEEERDRLMKSLQENVDYFEEACTGE